MKSKEFFEIFNQSMADYHIHDSIEKEPKNPYKKGEFSHLLYQKNWIDTVQWHLEDIIRDPEIDPKEALKIKRVIDASNQRRTDLVEYIDGYFLDKYKDIKAKSSATINTETIAWAIDRLSILALKIYHMNEEANRESADQNHKNKDDKLRYSGSGLLWWWRRALSLAFCWFFCCFFSHGSSFTTDWLRSPRSPGSV